MAIDNRYEGSYVVRHDGWYYLMGSAANCCAGPTTGYSVFAGRSRSPLGPFVDADGISLLDSRVGGTHGADPERQPLDRGRPSRHRHRHAGQTFIVYHALDRNEPWLNGPFGINRRPMLIDRLDWIDGWPRTRAGAGPSQNRQAVPVTGSGLGIVADDPAARGIWGSRRARPMLRPEPPPGCPGWPPRAAGAGDRVRFGPTCAATEPPPSCWAEAPSS